MKTYTCNRCGHVLEFGPDNRFVVCMWCWFAHGIEIDLHAWRPLDDEQIRTLLVRQYHQHMQRWLHQRQSMQLMVIE